MYVFFAELFAKLTVKTLVADNFKFRTMTSYSLTQRTLQTTVLYFIRPAKSHASRVRLTHFR